MQGGTKLRLLAAGLSAAIALSGCALVAGNDEASPASDRESGQQAQSTAGLVLRAPDAVDVGEPFEVTVSSVEVDDAAAFETVIRFDDAAVEFGGANPADPNEVEAVVTPQADDGVALAAYRTRPGIGVVEVADRFVAQAPGIVTFRLDAVRVVADDGTVLSDEAPDELQVRVGDAADAADPVGDAWSLEESSGAESRDVTDDGQVTDVDVSEVVLGWTELRAQGDPCDVPTRFAHIDADENGCIDISDLQAVNGGVGGGTPPSAVAMATAEVTHVVTSLSDAKDSQVSDGICAISGGGCSLRAAIQQANKNTGANRIEFNLPGSGVQTIQLTEPLPSLHDTTGGTTIDGYTQPGAAPNTDPTVSNAQIRVEVRGIGQSAGTAAFTVTVPGNTFRGLSVYNAFYGIKFMNGAADNNTVVGSFIGTDATGAFGEASGFTLGSGLWFYNGSSGNTVGTPAIADRNVISGNKTVGVKIEQAGSSGNVVRNNILGLTPNGTARRANNAGFDLQWNSSGNTIGGTGLRQGNIISGNSYAGVDLSHTTRSNIVSGNLIGTTPSGSSITSWSSNGDGVMLKDNPNQNVISHNIIGGNSRYGIWTKHNYTDRNYIVDNRIGVGLDGSPVPNSRQGILLTGEDHQFERNIIAYNGQGGVLVNNDMGGQANYPAALTRMNRFSNNSFFDNTGLGMDITPTGSNANDAGDGDAGVQDLLNFPELTSVATGSIGGTTCAGCTVEVYAADNSGEGRQRVATATADGTGAFLASSPLIAGARPFTALAIDTFGNTSEFASPVSPEVLIGPWVTPTSLQGAFVYQNVNGTQVAMVPDAGAMNSSGASGTANRVLFDVQAPTDGLYAIEAEVTAASGSSDSFWVEVDLTPSNGFRWDVAGGTSVHSDLVNHAGVADPFLVSLTGGAHQIRLSMREDGTGIARLRLVRQAGTAATGLFLTGPGDQSTPQGAAADLQVVANDPDGGVITHSALGLPPGLSIDLLTGHITGTATTAGTYPVNVYVNDGVERATTSFNWVVLPPNSGPVLTNPGPQVDLAGESTTVVLAATDPDGDPITYGASGLPPGLAIDTATGVISGVPTTLGTYTVTITAADPFAHVSSTQVSWQINPGAFTCSVDGATSTLSWTNQADDEYYVRHIHDGVESYLGAVQGLSRPVTKLYGTYSVSFTKAGATTTTTCPGPNPPPPPFTCSVDGATSTLSWTDQLDDEYYVRHIHDGVETYLGAVQGLSRPITKLYGTYKVTFVSDGITSLTTCLGPNPPPAPFSCSIDPATSTLSWTDQGASSYSVRRINADGTETFVKTVNGLSTTITQPDRPHIVLYWVGGTKITTTCFPP